MGQCFLHPYSLHKAVTRTRMIRMDEWIIKEECFIADVFFKRHSNRSRKRDPHAMFRVEEQHNRATDNSKVDLKVDVISHITSPAGDEPFNN